MVDSEIVLQYFLSKVKLKLNKGNCFSIFLQIKFKLTKQTMNKSYFLIQTLMRSLQIIPKIFYVPFHSNDNTSKGQKKYWLNHLDTTKVRYIWHGIAWKQYFPFLKVS